MDNQMPIGSDAGHPPWVDELGARGAPGRPAPRRRRTGTAFGSVAGGPALATTFAEGGVPGLARLLGCTAAEALDVALLYRLVPPAYRRRARLLARLHETGLVPSAATADPPNLSPWTAVTYRRQLGVAERGRLAS